MKSKLTALFYLLMRDHLPVGDLIAEVKTVSKLEDIQFTNKYLAMLAEDLVGRIESESSCNRQ